MDDRNMVLKKADIEKEIFVYFSKEEKNECRIETCGELDDVDKLCEVFKEKLRKCKENLNESSQRYSNLDLKNGFYIFYFLYLKNTEEVIFVDLLYGRQLEIIKDLQSKIENIKNRHLIRTDLCLEAIVFFEERISKAIIGNLDKLQERALYYKDIKSSDKLESLLNNLTNKLKKFPKIVINTKFLTITIAVYVEFITLYLTKLCLPLELIYSENLKIFIESLVFLLYTLIGIVIFTLDILPILVSILITIMIFFSLYYTTIALVSFAKVINDSYFIKKLNFYISKFLRLKDIIFFKKILFLVFLISLFLMSLIIIVFIYAEPIVFVWKYAFPNSKVKLIDYFDNKFNANVAKQEILKNLYASSPNLRFIEINKIEALELAEKDGKVYFYQLKDIKNILKKYIYEESSRNDILNKKKNKFKKEFCEKLNSLDKSLDCCKSKSKNKCSSEEKESCISQTKLIKFKIFYNLFYLPSKYGLYPYDIVLKEKIQSIPIKKVKFQNLNENEIIEIFEDFCYQIKREEK